MSPPDTGSAQSGSDVPFCPGSVLGITTSYARLGPRMQLTSACPAINDPPMTANSRTNWPGFVA
jgi:hypothetical protein